MSIIYPLDSMKAHPSRAFPGYKSTAKRHPKKPLSSCRTRCRN